MTVSKPNPHRPLLGSGRYRPMRALAEFQRAYPKFWESNIAERMAGVQNRKRLILEESKETLDELDLILDGDPAASLDNLAKELADTLYVVYGTADYFGIPLEQVFQEVHRSNLTKLAEDGRPFAMVEKTGKFAKGPHYVPADVHGVLTGEWL